LLRNVDLPLLKMSWMAVKVLFGYPYRLQVDEPFREDVSLVNVTE
jgi:hypothetical protein